MDEELKEIMLKQRERQKSSKTLCPYVFPNIEGTGQINNFRKAWRTACKDAKIGTKRLFHDLRRTAVRNLVRAGIPERVAMMISGHKTRSVFDRYNIVSDTDLIIAAEQAGNLSEFPNGYKDSVTIHDFPKKKGISRCRLTPSFAFFFWCRGTESNCRHADFQSAALPTELPRHEMMLVSIRGAAFCQDFFRPDRPRHIELMRMQRWRPFPRAESWDRVPRSKIHFFQLVLFPHRKIRLRDRPSLKSRRGRRNSLPAHPVEGASFHLPRK